MVRPPFQPWKSPSPLETPPGGPGQLRPPPHGWTPPGRSGWTYTNTKIAIRPLRPHRRRQNEWTISSGFTTPAARADLLTPPAPSGPTLRRTRSLPPHVNTVHYIEWRRTPRLVYLYKLWIFPHIVGHVLCLFCACPPNWVGRLLYFPVTVQLGSQAVFFLSPSNWAARLCIFYACHCTIGQPGCILIPFLSWLPVRLQLES